MHPRRQDLNVIFFTFRSCRPLDGRQTPCRPLVGRHAPIFENFPILHIFLKFCSFNIKMKKARSLTALRGGAASRPLGAAWVQPGGAHTARQPANSTTAGRRSRWPVSIICGEQLGTFLLSFKTQATRHLFIYIICGHLLHAGLTVFNFSLINQYSSIYKRCTRVSRFKLAIFNQYFNY